MTPIPIASGARSQSPHPLAHKPREKGGAPSVVVGRNWIEEHLRSERYGFTQ